MPPSCSVLATLAACGREPSASGTGATKAPVQHAELTIAGIQRSYRLFVPPTLRAGTRVPLVVVLHGGGNTGESMVKTTQFDRFASSDGFVVAYPQGLGNWRNGGFCCGTASTDGVDDVAFLTAMLDRVQADQPVDPARVFLVGVSNGAIMAYKFACDRADRVAALASVAGAMLPDDCRPSRPVSVLEVHGTNDTSLPFNGGRVRPNQAQAKANVPPTADVVKRWVDANRCPGAATVTADGPVTTSTWSSCQGRTTVSLVAIQGGGHTWFGPGLGPANGAIDTSTVITAFFARHA